MKQEKYGMMFDDSKMGIQPKMTTKEKMEWDQDCERLAEKLLNILPPHDFESKKAAAV